MPDARSADAKARVEKLRQGAQALAQTVRSHASSADAPSEGAGDLDAVSITVKAEIASVTVVTATADELLERMECPLRVQMQIDVAIDELMANICSYAYGDGEGDVTVIFEVIEDGGALRMTFVDEGIAFNPLERPEPDITLPLNKRGIGGYGIFIVRRSMDEVSYERKDGRNVFSVVKRFA